MQSYAVAKEADLLSPHNVAALSLVAACSIAYLGRALLLKNEHARRAKEAQIAQIELVEEVNAAEHCTVCERRKKQAAINGPAASTSASVPAVTSASSKRSRRDRKGKGPAFPPRAASPSPSREPFATRNAAVQTESTRHPIAVSPYPPDDVLAFSWSPRPPTSTSSSGAKTTDTDDDAFSDLAISESPSAGRRSLSRPRDETSHAIVQPVSLSSSQSRAASPPEASNESASTDVSSSTSPSHYSLARRRSSSGATSLSIGSSTAAFTPVQGDAGFMTPPTTGKKSRKQRQKEALSLPRREVVGLPKPALPTRTASQTASVSRSNTLKASTVPASNQAYWTQDPLVTATGPLAVPSSPKRRLSSASSNRSSQEASSAAAATAVAAEKYPESSRLGKNESGQLRPPSRQSSADASESAVKTSTPSASAVLPHPPPVALPFTPPISPSPHRHHSNGATSFGHSHGVASPSPISAHRHHPFASVPYDPIAAAQQTAYIFAQQHALMQSHMPRNAAAAAAAANQYYQLMGMSHFATHPSYVTPSSPPQMGSASFVGPTLSGSLPTMASTPMSGSWRSSHASPALTTSSEEGTLEIERMREQLDRLREKSKQSEIDNERKNKELEIARWRLQCVEVERKQDDRQTQEAIALFVERAEAAERRVRDLEAKLGLSHESAESTSVESSSAAPPFRNEEWRGSPRPRSPAGLAALDMSLIGAMPNGRAPSPMSLSPIMRGSSSPSFPASLPSPNGSSSGRRGRRQRRQRRGSTSPRPSTEAINDESDDDLVILLHSPSIEPLTLSSSPQPPPPVVVLGLGIQSPSSPPLSSDEAKIDIDSPTPAPTADPATRSGELPLSPVTADVRVHPATPDSAEGR